MSKRKGASMKDKLGYLYIRKIKKWMFCPCCQKGKMTINKKSTMWTCEDCGYKLSAAEFEDDYVFWFCDECGRYLNVQTGFDRKAKKHVCAECGFENDTTFDNIKGICSDCGKVIPDADNTLCADCLLARRAKAKERLIAAGKIAGVAAAVAGATYLAMKSDGDENSEYLSLPDDEDDDETTSTEYPTCNMCGSLMTEFDGWAWYTCPDCGNSVRIIDGVTTWESEIFKPGKKEFHSDFELADFCHGGDLTED